MSRIFRRASFRCTLCYLSSYFSFHISSLSPPDSCNAGKNVKNASSTERVTLGREFGRYFQIMYVSPHAGQISAINFAPTATILAPGLCPKVGDDRPGRYSRGSRERTNFRPKVESRSWKVFHLNSARRAATVQTAVFFCCTLRITAPWAFAYLIA